MFTYLILNIIVVLSVVIALKIKPRQPSRAWLYMFIALVILTLIFDSLMISLGLFFYSPDKILSIKIGAAPVEDFFYAVLAAIMIPALWYKLDNK